MVPIFIGIVPVSLFHAKSRAVRLVRRVNEPGIRPVKLLWSSFSETNRLRPPMVSGMAPTGSFVQGEIHKFSPRKRHEKSKHGICLRQDVGGWCSDRLSNESPIASSFTSVATRELLHMHQGASSSNFSNP